MANIDMSMKDSIAIIRSFADEMAKMKPDLGVAISTTALNMAIKAMEKQVELKATKHDGMFIVCPSCKNKVLPTKHCSECGQALTEVKA